MSDQEKLYEFSVPTVIYARRVIFLYAESSEEAKQKLAEGDWNDCETDETLVDHDFASAELVEVYNNEESSNV